MEEYVGNSNASKAQKAAQQEKEIHKVVTGSVKTQKKGGLQKLSDVFISEDVSNVKSYILMDVLVPAMKKAISDIVTNGIEMILYGESGSKRSSSSGSKVSYRSYYESRDRDPRDSASYRPAGGFDYDNIVFNNRGDAERVLTAMQDIIDLYGVVSVGDLYDLADVSTTNYMANKYGWSDIRIANTVRVRDGYILKLPKPLPIN